METYIPNAKKRSQRNPSIPLLSTVYATINPHTDHAIRGMHAMPKNCGVIRPLQLTSAETCSRAGGGKQNFDNSYTDYPTVTSCQGGKPQTGKIEQNVNNY